jgi:H+/Na+-translocating ferredoxin:NAD+ oxidoreductase subunit E
MEQTTAHAEPTIAGPQAFLDGLWKENPVFVQLLGMCPTLAVSNSVINAVAMGLATTFVLVGSNAVVSLVRALVPKQIRIATFIVIIATFVTVAEYILEAISLDVHKALGPFVPLIVVNCIILGRAESFASRNPVLPSILDGLGSGAGFTFAIFCMGTIREILGSGTFLGFHILGSSYQPWVIMVLPGGGFFVLGTLLLVVGAINRFQKGRAA